MVKLNHQYSRNCASKAKRFRDGHSPESSRGYRNRLDDHPEKAAKAEETRCKDARKDASPA